MAFELILSENFDNEAKKLKKKYPSLSDDLEGLFDELENNPQLGTPIGQDCYKIRLHIKSKKQVKAVVAESLRVSKSLMKQFTYFLFMTNLNKKIFLINVFTLY